jgi:UDP-2,3-diacylglucosamine pyrophosphatase LpxH
MDTINASKSADMKHSKRRINTLIISDIHLGSNVSRARELIDLLKQIDFTRLILLGDIVDKMYQNRLNNDHWELLSEIRKLTSHKEGNKEKNSPSREVVREVIWVQGNHDEKWIHTVSRLIGAKECREYAWEENGKRFLAIHGDQFDHFIFNEKTLIGHLGHLFYLFLQKIDRRNTHIVRLLDSSYTSGLQLSEKVSKGAAKYAQDLKMSHVFCGHTHTALEKIFFDDGVSLPVHYYNVGCWTRSPSTYGIIDEKGLVKIEEFQ